MIFQLTCKNCRISEKSREYLSRYINKVQRALLKIPPDEITLKLVIKKNTDRYHPPRIHPHPHKNYSDKKTALAVFEGSLTFRLFKKRFYAAFKGASVNECVKTGFERLLKEIDEFRNLRYSAESDYPDRRTIRGGL